MERMKQLGKEEQQRHFVRWKRSRPLQHYSRWRKVTKNGPKTPQGFFDLFPCCHDRVAPLDFFKLQSYSSCCPIFCCWPNIAEAEHQRKLKLDSIKLQVKADSSPLLQPTSSSLHAEHTMDSSTSKLQPIELLSRPKLPCAEEKPSCCSPSFSELFPCSWPKFPVDQAEHQAAVHKEMLKQNLLLNAKLSPKI